MLQTPGRRGLGPGHLGAVRPVASWRVIQATRGPESAPTLGGSPVLAAATRHHFVLPWKQASLLVESHRSPNWALQEPNRELEE